jgi:hypothetical protein
MLTLTEPPFGAALCVLNALLRRGTLRVAYTIMEMKADTTMTIRMDRQVKQKAQNIFCRTWYGYDDSDQRVLTASNL